MLELTCMAETKKPYVLAILDGWGVSKKNVGNPIAMANKPVMNAVQAQFPNILLRASGLAVGMTWGEEGNSEVGHINLGAGRIVEQYLSRINRAISDDTFFSNPAFTGAFNHAKENNSHVHIIGLLTAGTVHASFNHLVALIKLAKKEGVKTYLHLFLDGKDSGLQEAPKLLDKLQNEAEKGGFEIATFIGRNYAMDRDNKWDLTQTAYELLANAKGEKTFDIPATIRTHYQEGKNDQTMPPVTVEAANFSGISDNDALIFFNFREDSMRQILRPFIEKDFSMFERPFLENLYVCTMTQYLENPADVTAFPAPHIVNVLAEVLQNNGKKQLHVAETEKYAHVTFFFNGLTTEVYKNEIDIFVKSDSDHEKNPAMKSREITHAIIKAIEEGAYDFIVLNFANADVLAHTGNLEATEKGVEAVDLALGIIMEAVLEKDGALFITADHGNGESLIYKGSGDPETKHNTNPVPFYLVMNQYKTEKTPAEMEKELSEVSGVLADVAPTILEVMGISQPEEMTGNSLLSTLLKK